MAYRNDNAIGKVAARWVVGVVVMLMVMLVVVIVVVVVMLVVMVVAVVVVMMLVMAPMYSFLIRKVFFSCYENIL